MGKICRWILLFQEFDFEIIVKLGHLNARPDHLSWIEISEEPTNIENELPDAQLFKVDMVDDYYEQIIQFLVMKTALEELTRSQKKQFVFRETDFQLSVGQLYKLGPDEIFQ